MDEYVTPQMFGASGDGVSDDTEAIEKAFSAAHNGNRVVYFPAGTYRCNEVSVPDELTVKCDPTWSYSLPGQTSIIPADVNQKYIFDISNSIGLTLHGICFDGRNMGEGMHGLFMNRERHTNMREHSIRLDTVQVRNCTGNGMHLEGAWAVTIRHSQCYGNHGHGVYFYGCDGFVSDNWFSANGKSGFGCDTWNSAVNFTSNRIEWNKECGLLLCGSMRYNITGNYFDRAFGPAIIISDAPNFHKRLDKWHTVIPSMITITGNTIVRSAKEAEPDSDMDCHILMRNASNVVITGNTFNVWKDDGRNGRISPNFGIVYEGCAHCVISNNTMLPGAVKELFVDKGGHGEGMIVKDNPGSVVPEKGRNCQDPFTPVHFMLEGKDPWYSEKLKGENND